MAKIFNYMHGLLGKKALFPSGNAALVRLPKGIIRGAILLFIYGLRAGIFCGAVLCSSMNGTPFSFLEGGRDS